MEIAPRPIAESYWVLPGRFLAGEYPGRHDAEATRQRMSALLQAGMDTFIDLTLPDELPLYLPVLEELSQLHGLEIAHRRFAVNDRGLPSRDEMIAALDAIDAALDNGHKVYLHCWGGVGRTGTTVGCYLVRHGKTGQQALDQIARWWWTVPKNQFYPRSPETDEQMQFILDWHESPLPPALSDAEGSGEGQGEG